MSRLIISFYDNFSSAYEAIKELVDKGFCQNSISLVAHQAAYERSWNTDRSKPWTFLNQPVTIHLPGIGFVLVSGSFASELRLIEAGPNPLVRVLECNMVPEADAHAYTEGVRRRGILVIVRAERATSSRALFILEKYCPVDILDLAAQWRRAGWTRFDDTARPLTSSGLNWPSCITSLPGDGLLDDGVLNNWPQNIVRQATDLP